MAGGETGEPYDAHIQDLIATAAIEMPSDLVLPPSEPVAMVALPELREPRVEWRVPSVLASDALAFPVVPKAADANPVDPGPEIEASATARTGYSAFVAEASRSQREFIREAAETTREMGDRYRGLAGAALEMLQSNLRNLDFAREQALIDVDRNADAADGSLEIAYRNAVAATHASSARAHARIEANYTSADVQIKAILDSLVESHNDKFNLAIKDQKEWDALATKRIEVWSIVRAAHYPTVFGGLDSAKNEERQRVAPDLAAMQLKDMHDHTKQVLASWEFSRASTVYNIRCAYRCPLDQHKEAIHTKGRAQITDTLQTSLDTLRTQTRDGRAALASARLGARGQVEAMARVGKEKLNGETRAVIAGAQRETQVAQRGVMSATEASAPAFSRLVQRFEDSIRRASRRGALAVAQVARTMPGDMSRSLQALRVGNFERLSANGRRLERSVVDRRAHAERVTRKQSAESQQEVARAVIETGSQLAKSADDFSIGFDQFAQQITWAADAWAEPFKVRFDDLITNAHVSIAKQLRELMNGGGGTGGGGSSSVSMALESDVPGAKKREPKECAPCSEAEPEEDKTMVARREKASARAQEEAALLKGEAQAGDPSASSSETSSDSETQNRPPGFRAQIEAEEKYYMARCDPREYFEPELLNTDEQIHGQLKKRMTGVGASFTNGGFWDPVNDTGITDNLRGITRLQGSAIEEMWNTMSGSPFGLRDALRFYQCPMYVENDDYRAAIAYLNGNLEEGAHYELQASIGFFNDQESRIERTTGALDKEQLATLEREHAGTLDYVADHLGGTDLEVFNALRRSEYAVANSMRMEEEVDEARLKGDRDAAEAALSTRTSSTEYAAWTRQLEKEKSADQMAAKDAEARGEDAPPVRSIEERIRSSTVEAMAERLKKRDDILQPLQLPGQPPLTAEDRVSKYVTRPIDVQLPLGRGSTQLIPQRYEGAHRDLADALIRSGTNSPEARAARFGIELERGQAGKEPRPDKLLLATRDPRFVKITPEMTREQRIAALRGLRDARAEREAFIRIAATRYGGMGEKIPADVMKMTLGLQLSQYMDDGLGANFVRGIVMDERMSPTTAAWGMRHAMESRRGTDEDLLYNIAEHMDRDELDATRAEFRRITISYAHPMGRSLDAALGIYGEEDWEGGELSGDDRLRMERAMMGVPRNERERFETSMFALQQQRRETGGLGKGLAGGSFAERSLVDTEAQLLRAVGGTAYFDRRGRLLNDERNANVRSAFDATGRYQGSDREALMVHMGLAPMVAQNYSAYIDSIANAFAIIIAIAGVIAAAVITAVTLGAGAPLLVGAGKALMLVALATGGAQMLVASQIKGGRYGWEQALFDVGMTLISVATAGIGAGLGSAAKAAQTAITGARLAGTSVALARANLTTLQKLFTGSPILNQMLIGSMTGAIQGFGTTVLDPETWNGGAGDVIGNLLGGTARGIAGGAAQGAASGVLENVKLPFMRMSLGERMQHMGMLSRGITKSAISNVSGMAGRSAEIGVDRLRGKYRGDWGDALIDIGEAGKHAMLMGFAEGMADARGQRWAAARNARKLANETARMEQEARRPLTDSEEQARARALMGEPIEPQARPLLAAEAAGLPPQAGRALPELESASPPRKLARAGGDDEADSRASRPFSEGTAAAVDENFRGDAARAGSRSAANRDSVRRAVGRLLDPDGGELRNIARLPDVEDTSQILLDTPHGQVRVNVKLADGVLPPLADGSTPVARFDATGRGEYTITVSGGASRRHVERALAHELAEIHAGHGRTQGRDVLRARGGSPVDAEGRPQLSPHDQGRIAEIRVIARQLAAGPKRDERAMLLQDLESLADHLGLGSGDAHAAARVRVVLAALGEDSFAGMLMERITGNLGTRGAIRDSIDERTRAIGGAGRDFEDLQTPPPTALARGRGESAAVGDRTRLPAGVAESLRRAASAAFGRELRDAMEGAIPHNARTAFTRSLLTADQLAEVMTTGRLPQGVEFHHIMTLADFPEWGDRAEVGVGMPRGEHRSRGHNDVYGAPVEAAAVGRSHPNDGYHLDPLAAKGARAPRGAIAEGAAHSSNLDRDIVISQRAQVRQLESVARRAEAEIATVRELQADARSEGRTRRVANLEDRLISLERTAARARNEATVARDFITELDASIAARRAAADDTTPLPSGTAAAVRGSTFRGDAEGTARPLTAVLDEAAKAVDRLTTHGGLIEGANGVRQPDGSIIVRMTPPGGGDDIEVRIVARPSLDATPEGVPVARFIEDPEHPQRYLVEMSARAPAGTARRALAHELTEIRHAHADRISHNEAANLLRPGGYGAEGRRLGPERLTPHDRGRLAELRVLAEEVETARESGDVTRAARLQDETQRLLAHLGVIDESRGAGMRLSLAQSALDDASPAVRLFMDEQVAAARKHPFLRQFPDDDLGRRNVLIDRLAHARAMGDTELEKRVFQQAQGLVHFIQDKKHLLVEGEGSAYPLALAWLAKQTDPRMKMLSELAEYVKTHERDYRREKPNEARVDPAKINPDLVASTDRYLRDYENRQSWEEFQRRYFGPGAAPEIDDLNRAFYQWASGHIVDAAGGVVRLLGPEGLPRVLAQIGPKAEVPEAVMSRAALLSNSKSGTPRTVGDVVDARRDALADARNMRAKLAKATPAEAMEIKKKLKDQIPKINNPTEALGDAAAMSVASERFGATKENSTALSGSNRPDLMIEATNPERIVVIEAKGADSDLGFRKSRDGTRMVQQGTREYLESLAADMIASKSDTARKLGRKLELALRKGEPPVEYYLVRQPVPDSGPLPPPVLSQFILSKP
jgi:hypothetical protein